VQFLDQTDVPFTRLYRYDMDDSARDGAAFVPAQVVLRLENRKDAGLGKPLPAGDVTVFEAGPDRELVFTGEDSIRDMAVGLPVEVRTGRSSDVRAKPVLVRSRSDGEGPDKRTIHSWEVTLSNDKAGAVTFQLRQPMSALGTEIVSESRAHRAQAGYAVWDVPLAPAQRTNVTYEIKTRG
jgi:hypothetical protein